MPDHSFTTAFTVDQSPETVFAAINNVRGWWSEDIDGRTDQAGKAYDYRYKDLHRCKIEVSELVPAKKVVWRVLENYFSFTEDETEWTATEIVFDISEKGAKTEIRFTHQGLVPAYECYDICADGWRTYINGSLRNLITTGKGDPNLGKPKTESERALAR